MIGGQGGGAAATKAGETKMLDTKALDAKADKKKKIEIAVLIVLIPLFILLIYNNLIKPSKAKKVKPAPAKTQAAAVKQTDRTQAAQPITKETVKELRESDDWGRNPFSFTESKDSERGPLQLEGIVYGGVDNYAVINQKIVKVGQQIADKKVIEIQQNKVILQSEDGTVTTLKT